MCDSSSLRAADSWEQLDRSGQSRTRQGELAAGSSWAAVSAGRHGLLVDNKTAKFLRRDSTLSIDLTITFELKLFNET